MRGMLTSRIAGLREHRGEVVGPALWEPIITMVSATGSSQAGAERDPGRRTPRRYLLSGLVRCGRCGGTLYSAAGCERRRYVCLGGLIIAVAADSQSLPSPSRNSLPTPSCTGSTPPNSPRPSPAEPAKTNKPQP